MSKLLKLYTVYIDAKNPREVDFLDRKQAEAYIHLEKYKRQGKPAKYMLRVREIDLKNTKRDTKISMNF